MRRLSLVALAVAGLMGGALLCPVNQARSSGTAGVAEVGGLLATPNRLPVVRYQQEGFYSCWAACAELIMEYLGAGRIRQCEQANAAFNLLNSCDDEGALKRGGLGDAQWRPEFGKWGFDFEFRPNNSEPVEALTWPELTTEINEGRPVAFGWFESSGISHLMVLIGYDENKEGKAVIGVDPFYGEEHDPFIVSFSDYNGSSGTHPHWGDYFRIRPIGFE